MTCENGDGPCDTTVTQTKNALHEDTEPMDTKYLRRRGNVWYIDFTFPVKVGGDLAGKRFRLSLETGDYQAARGFRDKYVIPLLQEARERDLLESIAAAVARTSRRTETMMAELLGAANIALDLNGAIQPRENETVEIRDLADDYVQYLEAATDLAPASIKKYTATFNALCLILGDDLDAESMTTEHMVAFRDELLTKPVGWQKRTTGEHAKQNPRTISPNSVNRDLQRIRTWIRWAMDEGKLRRQNVPGEGVKCKSIRAKHKERPTVKQANQLLALPCPPSRNKEAWIYLPLIARYTGCRIGEIAGLTAEDMVDDHGIRCLAIQGDHLKTTSSHRVIPIVDKLAPHIDALLKAHPADRLFPDCGDWTSADGVLKPAHYFLSSWNEAAKEIGPFSFHSWRVYVNDELVRNEVDIIDRERILGHRNRSTQAAYTSRELGRYLDALNMVP